MPNPQLTNCAVYSPRKEDWDVFSYTLLEFTIYIIIFAQ